MVRTDVSFSGMQHAWDLLLKHCKAAAALQEETGALGPTFATIRNRQKQNMPKLWIRQIFDKGGVKTIEIRENSGRLSKTGEFLCFEDVSVKVLQDDVIVK